MLTFIFSIAALIAGYIVYDRIIIEKNIGPLIPPFTSEYLKDGIDYNQLPRKHVFFIQLSNIAGPAAVFYALSGALWGPSIYLWIVLGTVLGGCIHDFFSGILSVSYNGASLQDIAEKYFGKIFKCLFSIFLILFIIVLGVIFIREPASMLSKLGATSCSIKGCAIILMLIYIAGSFFPINKTAGRIYIGTGIFILVTVALVVFSLIFNSIQRPLLEMTLQNIYPQGEQPIWPMMFIAGGGTVFSGLHAVQTPITARCISNTVKDRRIYTQAMIVQGMIALVWATAGIAFYYNQAGAGTGMRALLTSDGTNADSIRKLCLGSLGNIGGTIVFFGVIISLVTTGISVFRSGRIILCDSFKLDSRKPWLRFLLCLPLVGASAGALFLQYGVVIKWIPLIDFILAGFVLWLAAIYLYVLEKKRNYFYTALLPACFIILVSFTYLFYTTNCFALFNILQLKNCRSVLSSVLGLVVTAVFVFIFRIFVCKRPEKWVGKLQQV